MLNKKIFIKTFGCQMNEYDSNRIYDSVSKLGFVKTTNQSNADCYILNTCHIRDKAKEKVYHEIGRVKKLYRDKKKPIMVVAGCVAQAENEEMMKREPYIDIILGPQSYHKVNDLLKSHIVSLKQEETEFDTISKFGYFDKIKNNNDKISAFLTIQEGCDKFCKFCVVPYTRGPEYSRDHLKILDEVRLLADQGTKEIILLGQNVSAYNDNEITLAKLIKKICKIESIERVRFTTSHPNDFDEELILLFSEEPKLMPQLHLPVQSGSDKILKLMNRNHTRLDYLKLIEKFKKSKPDIQFSSDFIIGFPGEDEEDHQDTINLIKEVNFTLSYSFIYSQRPGTPATNLDKLPQDLCQKRLEEIQGILFKQQVEFNHSMVSKENTVLFENRTIQGDQFFGRNQYMTPVFVKNDLISAGEIKKILIQDANRNNLFGKIA